MAWPLQDGGWWTTQCSIHVAPWLWVWCECFFFAMSQRIWFKGGIPADFALDPCNMSTLQGSCGEFYCTIGFEWCFKRPGVVSSYVSEIIWWTALEFETQLLWIINILKSIYFLNCLCFFISLFLPFTFSVPTSKFFSPVPDVWWTQKMSSVTSSQSRCPQRCGTGWPPLSQDRWAWCYDATRRNLDFAALSTPFRLESSLRGKFVYHAYEHSHIKKYVDDT